MKKIILSAFLIFLSGLSFAAREPLKEVVEIIDISNTNQKQIYDAAKIWMAQSFKSSNSVIQYEDANTGTIIGKGNMKYPCVGAWNCLAHENYLVLFTVKIDTKDNKARLSFSDLKLRVPSSTVGTSVIKPFEIDITSEKDKENIEKEFKDIASQFQTSISKYQINNDW